ncbi:hypothetical protein Tco_1174214 [Tanacetum coccineum]
MAISTLTVTIFATGAKAMGNLLGGRDVRVHVLFDSNALELFSHSIYPSTHLHSGIDLRVCLDLCKWTWKSLSFVRSFEVLVDFLIGGGGGGGVGVDYGVLVVSVLLVDDGFEECVGVLCG